MSKKTKKQSKPVARRWSLGVFTSKAGGEIVTYCRTDGTVAPYMAKKVTAKKASRHGVFVNMSYTQARAKLLKQAGGKASSKKPAAKEEIRKAA